MKDQYVILTGGKNNAGDFLIVQRVRELLKTIRPDRSIINWNAWEALDEKKLIEINNSRALILAGGPALQAQMYPSIYPLVEDLNQIEVPIVAMGIGWKSLNGNWEDSHDYPLSPSTHVLLSKINESGFLSSVRDYHTLNALQNSGYNSFMMTGDPALYDFKYLNKEPDYPENIRKIGFSLGVGFAESPSMEHQTKSLILDLQRKLSDSKLTVVFHHGLSKEFLNTHNPNKKLFHKQIKMLEWLEKKEIESIDISGSASSLMEFYMSVDLHIGFRVHAHIFMNSVSKLSILISEDGRAKALKEVIGGCVLDGYLGRNDEIVDKILRKVGIKKDPFDASNFVGKDILNIVKYESQRNFHKFEESRKYIDHRYCQMESFLKQLP